MKKRFNALSRTNDVGILITTLAGNLTLAYHFFTSLVWPLDHLQFVHQTAILVFIFEFLSLHATGMIFGSRNDDGGTSRFPLFLLGIYAIFALATGAVFGNWVAPGLFFVSVLTKIFGKSLRQDQLQRSITPIAWLVLWTFITQPPAAWWARAFPFPPEALTHTLSNATGSFIDYPQALLIWGIGYFLTLALFDIYYFFHPLPPPGTRLRDTNLEI